MISVPFSTPDIDGGFSEGKGLLTLDGDDLTIRVEVSLMGLFVRNTETVRFEITDLDQVRHKRTVLGDRITIRTQPPSLAMEVPGSGQGELILKTKKKHRRDVDALLDRLELWMVE
ncbi:MAG: hypothetical protein AAF791_07335 [Bacteroidota bacterium]